MKLGRLYGVGLGPGDPELVTLKALRVLRSVAVIAYPAPDSGDSVARGIAAQWLDRGQPEIAIRFPMRPGPPPRAIYQDAAAQIEAVLRASDDVAYLCAGDPLLYGSFAGLLAELDHGVPVAIVPGVTSITACAAAAGAVLAQRDETLSIVPATLPEEELAAALKGAEAAAVVKLGRHFPKLRRVLQRLGMLESAIYVEHAGWPSQRVAALAAVDPGAVPYFATALVRRPAAMSGAMSGASG
ncbi:MAG: precorrin-2 C(20)-methyltransferase [Alphaproteobacteria bacterium]